MNQSMQNRDERSVVVGRKSPVNDITNRFAPRGQGSKEVDRAPNQHLGSAVSTAKRDLSEVKPAELKRVLRDKDNVLFAMPDKVSFRGKLRAGKVLSSLHYDFAALKEQGVLLGAVEDEVVGVPQQGGSLGGVQVQLKDMFAALREAGFEVVPRGAAGDEVAELRAKVAELEAKQAQREVEQSTGVPAETTGRAKR